MTAAAFIALAALLFAMAQRPLVYLGIVAGGLPKTTGDYQVATTDINLPITMDAFKSVSSVALRLWYPQAKPDAKFPLIIYAPAWGGRRDDNSVMTAALASYGFVVAAIDDIAKDPDYDEQSPADRAIRHMPLDLATEAGRDAFKSGFDRRLALQAAKITAVVDTLGRSSANLPKGVAIKPGALGLIGASFGGSSAVEAAQRDPRIRAVVNLDGWIGGVSVEQPIPVPFATFNSMRGVPPPAAMTGADPLRRLAAELDDRERKIVDRQLAARPDAMEITIHGAGHGDFTDELYDPTRWRQWRPWREGMIAPERMRTIVDTYLVAFFTRHLADTAAATLAPGTAAFPEATIRLGR